MNSVFIKGQLNIRKAPTRIFDRKSTGNGHILKLLFFRLQRRYIWEEMCQPM